MLMQKLSRKLLIFIGIPMLFFYISIAAKKILNNVEIIKGQRNRVEFSIGVIEGNNPLSLDNSSNYTNPVLSALDVSDAKAQFVADPFIILVDNVWYMFFEILNQKDGKGDIGFATSQDGSSWNYQRIILDEDFHLSYPFVFENDGEIFMIPESSNTRSVLLYRAVDFPYRWIQEAVLLKGMLYTDNTLLLYDGYWYLFTETAKFGHGTLRLYFSKSLKYNWREHPQSPIVKDNENIARPAGRILHYDDMIIRVAQDGLPTYGNQVRAFRIKMLSPTTYIEDELKESPILEACPRYQEEKGYTNLWCSFGMHHIDCQKKSDGKYLCCVDGMRSLEKPSDKFLKIKISNNSFFN